ncbi:Fimbrial protein [Enterobacteriaceae bacterium bta3-1]|nr:Fimbrial protein [Enterobacteriaceae bacterium bta3-1]
MKTKQSTTLFAGFILVFFILTGSVHASCSGTTGIVNINIGTISISEDADNSTSTIYKNNIGDKSNDQTMAALSCTSNFTYAGQITNPVPERNDLEKVMLTDGSWSGLGFKFYTQASDGWYSVFHNASPPVSIPGSWTKYCFYSTCWNPSDHAGTIMWGSLSVYGGGVPAVPGNIDTIVTPFTADGYPAMSYHITGTVLVPSCNVDASTPTHIPLKTVDASAFPHKGTTAEDTPFDITLKCNNNVSVSLLLDGEENIDAQGEGVLALNGDSTASGIGIQLLYNSAPVKLNETFSVGNAVAGIFKIPMTARYYRSSDKTLQAGLVSASVVYSVSYK